ncbi:MAG: nucleotidyl transferase AbiEii/AbiGii toxin family protein [Deltaproteobacteria bacterium]
MDLNLRLQLRTVFADVLALPVEDDGVRFQGAALEIGPIREGQQHGGVRVLMAGHVTTAKVRLQVDVGFGDAITPDAIEVEFPAPLAFPAPRLRAYPRETVVAEKLEAMVKLGLANSRMKDFYDLVILARMFVFEGDLLVRAIRATFQRRDTPLPNGLPVALTSTFVGDALKNTQWSAFVRISDTPSAGDLAAAAATIVEFAEAPLAAAASATLLTARWLPGGPWR